MKEMVRMVATLTILCFLSGGMLSFLKEYTAPLIEEQELNKVQGPAIQGIFPSYTNNPVAERKVFTVDGEDVVVFPIKNGDSLIGVAIEQINPGYGGPLGAMVGFSLENNAIVGVGVTAFKETPGFGSRIYDDPTFRKQFASLHADSDIGRVSLLSGATVSSTSFTTSVKKAASIYLKLKNQFIQDFA